MSKDEKSTAPEVPVQEQQATKLKVEITNAAEFKELISATKENLQKIKDFKFEFKITR